MSLFDLIRIETSMLKVFSLAWMQNLVLLNRGQQFGGFGSLEFLVNMRGFVAQQGLPKEPSSFLKKFEDPLFF